jgi:hypothetical protein
MAQDALSISITKADGTIKRWGPDEPDAADVPDDLTFSTSIPGGDKDLSCSLLRRIDLTYSDQSLFDQVRVYGPGNKTAWQGRMAQFPRDHGDSFGIQPAAVGLSAHLKDDPAFREIYVDRDLSRWGGISVQRKINFGANTQTVDGNLVADGSGSPSIGLSFTGAWSANGLPVAESWYDAQSIPIGSLYWAFRTGPNVNFASDATWFAAAFLTSDDVASTFDYTGDLQTLGTTTGAGTQTATNALKDYAMVQLQYPAAGGTQGTSYEMWWTCLAVYGRHGLTKRGTTGATTAQGFYASDVVADIVERAAPLLTFTTGDGGSIQATDFVIPHLSFTDPVTAEDAISTVNAFHIYDWGVYDGEFFYRAPDPDRLTWQARLSDGAKLSLEGDTAEQVFNGVYVTYTDPSGRKCTVGPPGAVADATDASLADTSSTNPVNSHGIPKRWGRLDLGLPTTQAGAIQLGYVWLAERSLASRRGQVTLTGDARHPTEGNVPVWRIRAGDWITIADHPTSTPRKIIETSYSHGSRTITCTLDNTAAKVEAILERLGVFAIGRF